MAYQQTILSKGDFSHLINSPGSSLYKYLASNENIILRECFSQASGFSKSWLLRHHYAVEKRNIKYNYIPPLRLYHIERCSLKQPFFELEIDSKIIWESFHSKFATENYLFNNSRTYNLISHQKTIDLNSLTLYS